MTSEKQSTRRRKGSVMKKGIIFDMDGTLWDSSENVAKSWDAVVQKEKKGLRRITTKDIQNVMGLTMTEIAKTLFPMLPEPEAIALTDRCCVEENAYLTRHGGVLYPNLEDTLKILAKQYPLYIVSNCQKGYVEAFLEYYQFGKYFEDFECFGNNNREKAYNIDLVVRRNHLERAVYVGDIQGDYNSSKKAGVEFIHAAYGFGKIAENVSAIQTFSMLPQKVQETLG